MIKMRKMKKKGDSNAFKEYFGQPTGPCGLECWNSIKIGKCEHCVRNPNDPRQIDNYSGN